MAKRLGGTMMRGTRVERSQPVHLPQCFFTEMPAMVAPKNDPGISRCIGLIEGIEQTADLVIHVGRARKVCFHRGPPLLMFQNRGMAAGSDSLNGPFAAGQADIFQVVSAHGGSWPGVLLEPFEIFLWREEGCAR